MSNELTIHGKGLDQSLPLQESEIAVTRRKVSDIVSRCVNKNDPQEAFDYGEQVIKDIQLRGVELAHLIYLLHQEWARFGLEEALVDRIVAEWGLHKKTVQKYINIEQEVLVNEDIPDRIRAVLAEKSVRFLNKLVRPAREQAFTEGDWEEVAMLPDESSVSKYVNEAIGASNRGRPPEFSYVLYPDGSLAVSDRDGYRASLGVLRMDDDDDLRRRARAKLIEKLGVHRP
jgi:hypothetical protein